MPPKAKPDTAAYQKLKKDIKEGTIGTLYVFHGEEAYLRDFYLGQLKKKLLPAGMEEFNLHTLSGKEFDVKTLAQLVDCLPMMSERTLIVVNDYDIYKGDKDALAAVLRELPDYVCLVFVYDLIEYKADAAPSWPPCSRRRKRGALQPPGQGDLWTGVLPPLQGHDHDIGTEDAKYLIFLCGDLMNNLISEIGKIGSYAAHHRVTRQDIDAVASPPAGRGGVPDDRRHRRRELRQGGGGAGGSCSTCRRPPISCWRCWASSSASSTPPAWPSSTERGVPYLMELWGMRSAYPAERLMQSARRFSLPWCRRAVLRCGQTDLAMKSTGADGEELLIGLLMELAVKKGA